MEANKKVFIIGLGEIGQPLLEVVRGVYPNTEGYDYKDGKLDPFPKDVDVMHICFPYSHNFNAYVTDYIKAIRPKIVLIESTVIPGTTSEIRRANPTTCIVHSPVRGRIKDGFKGCYFKYTKFIGAADMDGACSAKEYYESLGFKTWVCCGSNESEFVKILNLSYFALLLGWNQELRRIAENFDLDFKDIDEFFKTNTEESDYRFPRPILDGTPIGGHCVMPALLTLSNLYPSKFLDAVLDSDSKRHRGE